MRFVIRTERHSLLKRIIRLLQTDIAVLLLMSLLYWASQLLTFRLGIIPADEGFAALTPLRLLQGQKPYTDFWWLYGPTGLLLNASLYQTFGVSLLTLRLAGIFAGYLALLLSWSLARRAMSPGWAGLAATTALALYRLPTYNYNHMYAAVIGLVALNAAWSALSKRRPLLWAISGGFIGLLFTFKANVGLQAALALSLCLLLRRESRTAILAFVGALFGVIAVEHALLLPWLGGGHTLTQVYAPQLAVARGSLSTWAPLKTLALVIPRSLSRFALRQVYYGALFFAPLLIPPAAWWASRSDHPRTRNGILLLALYSPAIYLQALLVADPMGSTGDNSALLPTTLLLGVYLLYRWSAAQPTRVRRLTICVVAVLAALLVYAGALLRYTTPGKFQRTLTLDHARGVRVSQTYAANLEQLTRFLQSEVAPDDSLAALPWGDLIPFLAERGQAVQAHEDFAEALQAETPKWLVLTNIVEVGHGEEKLSALIDSEYTLVREFGQFLPVGQTTRRTLPAWEDKLAYRVYMHGGSIP